jgi:hypothetical protein
LKLLNFSFQLVTLETLALSVIIILSVSFAGDVGSETIRVVVHAVVCFYKLARERLEEKDAGRTSGGESVCKKVASFPSIYITRANGMANDADRRSCGLLLRVLGA